MMQHLQNFWPHGNKICSLWAACDSLSCKTVCIYIYIYIYIYVCVGLTEFAHIFIFVMYVVKVLLLQQAEPHDGTFT